eukprot:2233198-Karenia_brevis.AAC.1
MSPAGGQGQGDLEKSLCNSIIQMISRLTSKPSSAETASLLEAIHCSSFGPGQKEELVKAVQAQITSEPVFARLAGYEKQSFASPIAHLNYFTAADWASIDDAEVAPDHNSKCSVVMDRLFAGGMYKLSEKGFADIVCSMWSKQWPFTVDEAFKKKLYDHVQQFK